MATLEFKISKASIKRVIDSHTSNVTFGEKVVNIIHDTAIDLTWNNTFTYVSDEIQTIIKIAAKNAKRDNLKSITTDGIWKAIDYAHEPKSASPVKSHGNHRGKGLGKGMQKTYKI
jgi:hypothetical protein